MIIAPSILAADAACLGEEIRRAEAAGADWVHVDIMDGHFVPNLSFGPHVVAAIRRWTGLPIDVHLMIDCPERFIDAFCAAGADSLTIHVELGDKVGQLISLIRKHGRRVGLSINPPTHVEMLRPWLNLVDLILVMTVNPGHGGQAFMPEVLPKIAQVAAWRRALGLAYRIQVDGGINTSTLTECARHGADTFVSGTTLFGSADMRSAIIEFREAYANALVASERS